MIYDFGVAVENRSSMRDWPDRRFVLLSKPVIHEQERVLLFLKTLVIDPGTFLFFNF